MRNCFLLFLILLTSCIDEYWPEMDRYENLLVVDGTLTDMPGPYTIRLSMTSRINSPQYNPLPGCSVTLLDNTGNAEQLSETEPGVYSTSVNGIQGVAGRQYKIQIVTPSGKTYSSPFEQLPAPVGIDSVYTEVTYHETADLDHDIAGLQFYVDTYRSEHDSSYYFWQLEETYEFNSDFYLNYLWYGYFEPFNNPDTFYTCWKTQHVDEFFTASTLNLTEPVLKKFPLHYVDTETRRLQVTYSLLVHQFTIDTSAYSYYDQVRYLMVTEGSLYEKQPYQVTGNVKNQDDPNEPVLGYFLVAGMDEKRIFIQRPEALPFYYPVCELIVDMRSLSEMPWGYWPIYISVDRYNQLGYASDPCFDCTANGGILEQPEFWK
jgi:hypothetical protein